METASAPRRWKWVGGLALLAVGILLVPLPGPGWPVVLAALGILGFRIPDLVRWLPQGIRSRLPSAIAPPVEA